MQPQIDKLNHVVRFYQQQLDVLAGRLAVQTSLVSQHQSEIGRLTDELDQTHQRFGQNCLTNPRTRAFDFQLANHLSDCLALQINQAEQQLAQAQQAQETIQTEVRKQLSRIEAIEKVIGRKSESLELRSRQRDQLSADERYLNTHFTGSSQ